MSGITETYTTFTLKYIPVIVLTFWHSLNCNMQQNLPSHHLSGLKQTVKMYLQTLFDPGLVQIGRKT